MSLRQDGIKNGFKQHIPFSTQNEENGKQSINQNGCQIEKDTTLNTATF